MGEQARLTTNAAGAAPRHSVGDGDAWGSSGGEYTSEEEEEEERRRRRRRERERKKVGVKTVAIGVGKGREFGEVRDNDGRVLPGAEMARLDRTV